MEKVKEYEGSGWNTAIKERSKDSFNQIDSGFRTIKADNKEQATKYMETHYTGVQDGGMFCSFKVWFEPCHYTDTDNGNKLFSFIVKRQLVEYNNPNLRKAKSIPQTQTDK